MEGWSCLNREADEAGFSTDVDFEVNAQKLHTFRPKRAYPTTIS
jgi:hypothetical protein